ncbi:hypothetical protein BST14_18895 [Mycobacterium arosiense ATCC BAA-1401 = DSM 45069]|uniref:DUF5135 domain-containing protein n=2 Tax=Mycobacterium arosiense TaxID=425468 RepID=A0A1W9ZC42_MYCAI|nr:hypothetical protein BST14_18895 [Mycobacterium arosiense ATCC BAA-1401 = DSM 45069]
MKVFALVLEFGGAAAGAAAVYFWLIRPWRRNGRIGLDGLLVLAWFTLYWQDTLMNYSQTWVTYNSVLLNLGSWNGEIPGWMSPNGNQQIEPVLLMVPAYIWAGLGPTLAACWLLRRVRARWPHLSNRRLAVICFIGFVTFDMVFEPLATFAGWWAWDGSIPSLTLFYGHYYQYPLYEAVLWGAFWAGATCLRFFVDDKGHTFAEKGITTLRLSPRHSTVVRLLALIGFMNALYLAYMIPMQLFGLHAEWPADIANRSYFTNELCGYGTQFMCPGTGVPISRPGAPRLGNNGGLLPPVEPRR